MINLNEDLLDDDIDYDYLQHLSDLDFIDHQRQIYERELLKLDDQMSEIIKPLFDELC